MPDPQRAYGFDGTGTTSVLVEAERPKNGSIHFRSVIVPTEPDILSPDCRDGKCGACTGDAWNDTTDEPTECQHACHGQENR